MGGAALKQGWQWNPRGQGLCCPSLLGTNKPWVDLIFKTCWTCWQEQSPRSWLQMVCLLLPTAFQLPSDSVCFLGVSFLVHGFSGGSWPWPCKGRAAVGRGVMGLQAPQGPSPAARRDMAEEERPGFEGAECGKWEKTAVASYSCWQA